MESSSQKPRYVFRMLWVSNVGSYSFIIKLLLIANSLTHSFNQSFHSFISLSIRGAGGSAQTRNRPIRAGGRSARLVMGIGPAGNDARSRLKSVYSADSGLRWELT